MSENIIRTFFLKNFEKKINEKSLYYAFKFPVERVNNYIEEVNNEPLCLFVEYLLSDSQSVTIFPGDVFQFSKFEDATINLCNKIRDVGNPGLNFLEVGKLLLDDGKVRKDAALTKYGENHVKTGTQFGLCFELTHTYFLSCIGLVYPDLDDDAKEKILLRLILRDKFIGRLLRALQNGEVDLRKFLYMLSDSTYIRRRSNIKRVWKLLVNSNEYDFQTLFNRIKF